MLLFSSALLLSQLLLITWYGYTQLRRIHADEKMAQALTAKQCERLLKFAPNKGTFHCTLTPKSFAQEHHRLLIELTIMGIASLLFSLITGYFLALLALRPMRDAVHQMDTFLDAMIHDLNTPLASASINVDALKLSDARNIKRQKRIQAAHQMLLQMQQNLRDSLRGATSTYNDEPIALHLLLQCFCDEEPLLHCTLAPTTIRADKQLTHRVISNLISNAKKYNRNNSPISMSRQDGRFTLADRGIGIKDTSRIFERYYREKSSMQGLGIGLGIVKQYTLHYNVPIEITSKVGVGTTITLNFNPLITAQ